MWRILSLWLLLLALPAHLAASPWPREAGTWFGTLSLGNERRDGDWRPVGEAWLEHGLRPRLTLSAKLRQDGAGTGGEARMRWHPATLGAGVPVGLSLGAGTADGRGELLAGAHLGRSFRLLRGEGWARLDLDIRQRTGGGGGTTGEAALQAGLRPGDGWVAILGARRHRGGGSTHTTFTSAFGRELSPSSTLLGEVAIRQGAASPHALSMILWQRF